MVSKISWRKHEKRFVANWTAQTVSLNSSEVLQFKVRWLDANINRDVIPHFGILKNRRFTYEMIEIKKMYVVYHNKACNITNLSIVLDLSNPTFAKKLLHSEANHK